MNKAHRYEDRSWAVEYSEKDRSFTIETLDYHAGPLKLPLQELMMLTGGALHSAEKPQDREPVFGISRKEKSLYIAVPEGWSGILRISRKELYQYGKKMGKRGRSRGMGGGEREITTDSSATRNPIRNKRSLPSNDVVGVPDPQGLPRYELRNSERKERLTWFVRRRYNTSAGFVAEGLMS